MKKLFAIALIAVSFAACNSGENKTETTTTDSSTVAPAVTTPAAPAVDSTKKDSTATATAPATDSTKKAK